MTYAMVRAPAARAPAAIGATIECNGAQTTGAPPRPAEPSSAVSIGLLDARDGRLQRGVAGLHHASLVAEVDGGPVRSGHDQVEPSRPEPEGHRGRVQQDAIAGLDGPDEIRERHGHAGAPRVAEVVVHVHVELEDAGALGSDGPNGSVTQAHARA